MGDTGSKDDKFFQRVSLAWLAQDFGSSVDVQGSSAAQHAQIQKIRASIARDIVMSKRSAPPANRKRPSQRPQPQHHTVLRATSGLPEVILGETKSFTRAPGPQQLRTKVAAVTAVDSKRGAFRASTNSTSAVAASAEIRDCKTSVGRLQSGLKGSSSNSAGGTSAPTASSRTAAVARSSSYAVSGGKAVSDRMQATTSSSLARSTSAPTWRVNPGPKQQPDGASKKTVPVVAVQQADTDVQVTTVPHQSDTCPSEEEGSDGSGDPDGRVQQHVAADFPRQSHLDLPSAVPTIPACGGKGCEGKGRRSQKKGHLQFSDSFEGGNIGKVVICKPKQEYTIWLRADTANDKFRLWFNFTISNAVEGQMVLLTIVNFSKTRSLFRAGMTPVFRSSTVFPQWSRLPPESCYYYIQESPGTDYALTMALQFHGGPKEVYEVAYSFPYPYTHLQRVLHQHEHCLGHNRCVQKPTFLRRILLCRSPQFRRVDLLVISDPMVELPEPWTSQHYTSVVHQNEMNSRAPYVDLLNRCSITSSGVRNIVAKRDGVRNVVFISGRVHPGETPASHVVHGLLDFLLSSDPRAAVLRKLATWVIVPMLNPDGVSAGNYRCDAGGSDLNRMWRSPSQDLEPSIYHTLKTMLEIDAAPQFSLDVFVDVHSHSNSRAGFLFMNPLPSSHGSCAPLAEYLYRLPKAMAGTAGLHLPNTLCYTFEISFFNVVDDPPGNGQRTSKARNSNASSANATAASTAALDNANSTATYHTMGKQLAMSFMPFYGITGASGGKVKGHNGRGVQNLRTEEPVETFSV